MRPRLARASPRRARSCLRLDRNLPPLERAPARQAPLARVEVDDGNGVLVKDPVAAVLDRAPLCLSEGVEVGVDVEVRALAAHGRDGDPGPDRLALFVVLGQEVETCVLVAGRALARRVEVELLAQLLQPLASGQCGFLLMSMRAGLRHRLG